MLTKFWGQPIYLGATVLLPHDYDQQTMRRYPGDLRAGALRARNAPYGFDEKNRYATAEQQRPRRLMLTSSREPRL